MSHKDLASKFEAEFAKLMGFKNCSLIFKHPKEGHLYHLASKSTMLSLKRNSKD